MRPRISGSNDTLWFYWGQEHMTFLRWMTLVSAAQIHNNVVLILRRNPVCPKVKWKERQDFQQKLAGHNWMENVKELPVKTMYLEDVAPEIARLEAPDVQTSDLLAWWLLSERGGTVADMDIVFLKNLPEIKFDVQVVKFEGYPKLGYVPVTFMQGRPCSVWRETYRRALQFYHPDHYEGCGSDAFIPRPISRLNQQIVFPWAGHAPWSLWHKWLFEASEWPEIPEDCCGIHWYAGHNQKHNQKINGPADMTVGAVTWAVKQVLHRSGCPFAGGNS